MNIFDLSENYAKLYVIGDVHGNFDMLANSLQRGIKFPSYGGTRKKSRGIAEDAYHDAVLIVAGDVGLGFSSKTKDIQDLTNLNSLLKQVNSHLYLVRGNHDDPTYYAEDSMNLSNIHTVPDYSVIKTKNYCTLCVGGATSSDRTWRQQREMMINHYRSRESKRYKALWWKDENFIYNKELLNEILSSQPIDSIVTHLPNYNNPKINYGIGRKDWFTVDSELEKDLKIEKENLAQFFEDITKHEGTNIKWWASGHEHMSTSFMDNGMMYLQLDDNTTIEDVASLLDFYKNQEAKKKSSKGRTLKASYLNETLNETLSHFEPVEYREPRPIEAIPDDPLVHYAMPHFDEVLAAAVNEAEERNVRIEVRNEEYVGIPHADDQAAPIDLDDFIENL